MRVSSLADCVCRSWTESVRPNTMLAFPFVCVSGFEYTLVTFSFHGTSMIILDKLGANNRKITNTMRGL